MKYTADPRGTIGAQMWNHMEILHAKLEAACAAFDELYSYAFLLKSENRHRAAKIVAELIKASPMGDSADGQ